MASRTTPTPDPGFAADTGANSLQTAIVNAIVLPTLQLIVWRMFTVMPTATSQPVNVRGYVMLYLGVLAVLPLVITISSLVGSYLQAGKAGVALDFSMTVAASFRSPGTSRDANYGIGCTRDIVLHSEGHLWRKSEE